LTATNIQAAITELDSEKLGYDSGSAGDGYIAYWTTAANRLAGDNDLYWDRENNQLELGGSLSAGGQIYSSLTITHTPTGTTATIDWANGNMQILDLESAAGDVTLTGTQTLTNKTLTAPIITIATTTDSGSGYTLVLTDQSKVIEMSNGSGNTLTIPTNSSVAFPIGTTITVLQVGSGQTTIAGAGVTINGTPGLKLRAQWSSATLIKRATNTWVAIGDLSA
jgi:hypothetical protein